MNKPRDLGRPWDTDKLVSDIKKSFEFAYRRRRINRGKDIPYLGPELYKKSKILSCVNGSKFILADTIENYRDDGKGALDLLIMCAIEIGAEQGVRLSEYGKILNTAVFSDLHEGCRKMFDFAYKTERKNVCKNIPYKGHPLTSYRLPSCNISGSLKVGSLKYDKEQGRDALDVLIMCMLWLGIEQGLRILDHASVGDRKAQDEKLNRDFDKLPATAEELLEKINEI